jgi:biopolymer transport protein ExbD
MAMNISVDGAGGDDQPILDVNTTPLIDVMLVLLVMLIITIPIQLHSVNLNLPMATPPPLNVVKPEVVKIDIDDSSTIYYNGSPVAGRNDLNSKLQLAAAQAEQPEVHVRPNKFAKYNSFVEVMVALKQNGLTKMGVVGSEQFIDK